MRAIKVKKSELMKILVRNREAHRAIFLEAQEAYREQVVKELESMLHDAREGRRIRRSVTLIEPIDQTIDYDRVISMMTTSVDEVMEVEEHEYQCYVQDEWDWSRKFAHSNRAYSATLQKREQGE